MLLAAAGLAESGKGRQVVCGASALSPGRACPPVCSGAEGLVWGSVDCRPGCLHTAEARVPAGQEVLPSPAPPDPQWSSVGPLPTVPCPQWPGSGLSLPSSSPCVEAPWAAGARPPFRLLRPHSAPGSWAALVPAGKWGDDGTLTAHSPPGLSWVHLNEQSASGTGSAVSWRWSSWARPLPPAPACALRASWPVCASRPQSPSVQRSQTPFCPPFFCPSQPLKLPLPLSWDVAFCILTLSPDQRTAGHRGSFRSHAHACQPTQPSKIYFRSPPWPASPVCIES